jgi:hypothetical protein
MNHALMSSSRISAVPFGTPKVTDSLYLISSARAASSACSDVASVSVSTSAGIDVSLPELNMSSERPMKEKKASASRDITSRLSYQPGKVAVAQFRATVEDHGRECRRRGRSRNRATFSG